VPDQTAAEIRIRAEQARRLSAAVHSRQAQIELQQIADALEAEAEKLESARLLDPLPNPRRT